MHESKALIAVTSAFRLEIHFHDQVYVVIFCNKPKGTTTENTEALRATQRKDGWQPA